MAPENPRSTAQIAKHPIHPILVPFPIVCFVGMLLTDLTYWRTADMMWADFSAWLVTVGGIMGWLAGVVGVIDLLGDVQVMQHAASWPDGFGTAGVLLVAEVEM